MREIKFRAWDKKLHIMRDAIEMYDWFQPLYNDNDEFEFTDFIVNKDDRFVLIQYTELKDNKDKELYFDDIIETYAGNNLLGKIAIKSLDDLVNLINEIGESGVNFKIIGNIYENPGLLKEK